ncbi:MAG: hypothetical protein ABSH01_26115 [Terriglobia bacterium]
MSTSENALHWILGEGPAAQTGLWEVKDDALGGFSYPNVIQHQASPA